MNAPSYLLNKSSRNIAQITAEGLNKVSIPRLSILGGRFTLIDGVGNKKPLNTLSVDVVIVDANPKTSKIYYEGGYDSTVDRSPTCFSDNGVAPSKNAKEPQHVNCATCPHNVWGSAINASKGTQSKQCQDKKKLAVIVPGEGGNMVFQFSVPPGSLKALGAYAQSVSAGTIGSRPADLTDVVTQISFPQPNTLGFKAVSFIDEQTFELINELEQQTDKLDILVGRKDEPIDNDGSFIPASTTKRITLAPKVYSGVSELDNEESTKRVTLLSPEANTGDVYFSSDEDLEEPKSRSKPSPAKSKQAKSENIAPKQNSNFGISTNLTQPDSALEAALADAFNLSV